MFYVPIKIMEHLQFFSLIWILNMTCFGWKTDFAWLCFLLVCLYFFPFSLKIACAVPNQLCRIVESPFKLNLWRVGLNSANNIHKFVFWHSIDHWLRTCAHRNIWNWSFYRLFSNHFSPKTWFIHQLMLNAKMLKAFDGPWVDKLWRWRSNTLCTRVFS